MPAEGNPSNTVQQAILDGFHESGALQPGEYLLDCVVLAEAERITPDGTVIVRPVRMHPTGRIRRTVERGLLELVLDDIRNGG